MDEKCEQLENLINYIKTKIEERNKAKLKQIKEFLMNYIY